MTRADEEIKKDVVDSLYWDDRVDASKVNVEVTNGTVTLRGQVPTYFNRAAAYDDTIAIRGIVNVRNQLSVRFPTGASIPSDLQLKTSIQTILETNPDIDVMDMQIDVNAGVVILRGTVDAYWEKMHAQELIASEPGVVLVENHLAIVPGRDTVDQDIAKNIMKSIEIRSAVNANDVNVKVMNGRVELDGTVPNWAARQAAFAAAAFTPGVIDVENRLAVSGIDPGI